MGHVKPPLFRIIGKKPQFFGTCTYYKVVRDLHDIVEVGGMLVSMSPS
jgi:hypothetical protein